MTSTMTLAAPGTLGTNAGPNTDGCLAGTLLATTFPYAYLQSHALPVLCITDDGGVYVDETTPANEATTDDVEIVGTTIAVDDAIYFGHATIPFEAINIKISTQGDYTTTTFAWEFWNGTAWTALAGLTDGTTAFEAAASTVTVSFTLPTTWATNTVDGVLAYWVRARCTATAATVTPCQIAQVWVIVPQDDGTFTSEITDLASAGAGDVALLPTAQPVVRDAFYFGMDEKFCKIKIVIDTAKTGTATLILEYWNGTAWTTLGEPLEDKSVLWTAAAGTHMISFRPPGDWAETDVNSANGYFLRVRFSVAGTVTAGPVATQAWGYPLTTGAVGVPAPQTGTIAQVVMSGITLSGTTADSTFLIVNATKATAADVTWTKGVQAVVDTTTLATTLGDELVLVQIEEDGTTEFANAAFYLHITD